MKRVLKYTGIFVLILIIVAFIVGLSVTPFSDDVDPDPPPVPAVGSSSANIFGVWHDRVGTQFNARIRITYDKTSFYVDSIFSDGSVVHRKLTQLAPRPGEIRRFLMPDSNHGDGYALNDDGDLLIFDNDGFIRKAKRSRSTED